LSIEEKEDNSVSPQAAERFVFSETLDFEHIRSVWSDVSRFLRSHTGTPILLDFERVKTFDSSGIALLRMIRRYCREHRMEMELRSAPRRVEDFYRYVELESDFPDAPSIPLPDPISRLGGFFVKEGESSLNLARFIGNFSKTCAGILKGKRRLRWKEILFYMQSAGYEALFIVFLLSFLIGLVMAFQAAVQLRQFGANIYVADLVSISISRELGPVFTAVILAGRSGSAFAAEIGTMKINEEVDALTVMGIEVTEFLVLPKVLALAAAGPLLTIFADVSAILGGVIVGIVSLDLTANAFMSEVHWALTLGDVMTGLFKSVVFAMLVSLIGCFRGLQTEKGAQSVGRQTTSAVVSGIFLIIAADAVFTVLFYALSW
jgi:phospholipid/cholesterol/gamma-HCH transport system permease protein